MDSLSLDSSSYINLLFFIGIATVVLNKPPVNSLNYEFLDEIKTQLNQLRNDKARGMILTSVCIVNHSHFDYFIFIYYQVIYYNALPL